MKRLAFLSFVVLAACQDDKMVDLEELKERTRANLVYVAGGTFKPGNYDVSLRQPDGEVEIREVGNTARQDVPEATVAGFYIQAHLPTFAEYLTFRHETGLPDLIIESPAEAAADMPFHEAEAYCNWLGELTGLQMRLPTENEWEYAARSRVLSPPFGTDNGNWEPPRNIWAPEDGGVIGNTAPAPGLLPPSPMGIYDLHGVLDQWVSEGPENDAPNERVSKGSSYDETGFQSAIPSRFANSPSTRQAIEFFPHLAPFFPDGQDTVFMSSATARCVVSQQEPPSETGFGVEIDVSPDALPEIFDAFVPQVGR